MAKTIKFNLVLNNKQIRDIENLQENFNVDDLLEVYNNKLLHRWLEVRGYSDYLEKVSKIETKDDMEIVSNLIQIFELSLDENKIKQDIYSLKFKKEKQARLDELNILNFKETDVINKYHNGYEELKEKIIANKDDFPFIKQSVSKIHDEYLRLFKLNYKDFYNEFIEQAPLTIFAVLMNEGLRNLFLSNDSIIKDLNESLKAKNNTPEVYLEMYNRGKKIKGLEAVEGSTSGDWSKFEDEDKKILIVDITNSTNVKVKPYNSSYKGYVGKEAIGKVLNGLEFLSDRSNHFVKYIVLDNISLSNNLLKQIDKYLIKFSGETKGYWKTIEPSGKKYMVIQIETGNFIRNEDNKLEELSSEDINGKFLILNGIAYKSNNPEDQLLYMEV